MRDGGQPGLALSHTNSSSKAPPARVTENKDQGAKLIYLDFFLTTKKIFFKLQKKTIIYILELSHSENELWCQVLVSERLQRSQPASW